VRCRRVRCNAPQEVGEARCKAIPASPAGPSTAMREKFGNRGTLNPVIRGLAIAGVEWCEEATDRVVETELVLAYERQCTLP